MPSDPTAEQLELRRKGRQRLIGAVALALAAVVFIPMVLDPEPRQARVEPLLAIPPKEGAAPLVTAKAPAPATKAEAPHAAPATAPEPPAKAAPEPAPAKPATPVPSPEPMAPAAKAKPDSAKAPAAKAKPGSAKAPRLEGFAVQVGAFREEDKLAQARAKVAAAHISHYTERLDESGGPLVRLRAGPFPTREAAEKAAARLKRAGLEGQVVPLP